MDKPENPYDPKSVIGKLYDGDWSRCTVPQIAKALHCCDALIKKYITKIKREHNYHVPYMRIPNLRGKECEAVKIVLPPSYQPKREIIQRNCDNCQNIDCRILTKRKAVTWINCNRYMPELEKGEGT